MNVDLSLGSFVGLTLAVDSNVSDYLTLTDSSNARSNYIIGSHVGGTADGLNIWDASGSTMLVSFSKQSIRFFQQVVGPVFDVGGALADTLNAATFGTGADSLETRIQAAINQASTDVVSRVYVPANMYPYSASSISFIDTVQMVREGGSWVDYDIIAYGADASYGSRKNSASIQAAISGAGLGGFVFIPAGTFNCSGLTNYGFAIIQGSGRSSILRNTTSGSTTLAIIRHPTNASFRNSEGNLDGIGIRDLTFNSDRAATIQALWLERVDHSEFRSLTFEAINGPAIHLGMVRESNFYNCVTRWCGQSADTAALMIDDAYGGTVEGSNTINFFGLQMLYSYSPSIQIATSASSYSYTDAKIRHINFFGFEIHGAIRNGPNFNGPAPQPDSALTHSLITLGSCFDIQFLGGLFSSAGQGAAFLSLQPAVSSLTSSGCTRVIVRDATLFGHTAPSTGTVTTFNSGVSLGRYCQIYLDNVAIDNSTRDVYAVSGSSIHLGLNVSLNGTSSISSTAYEPANRLTGVFAPRPAENLFFESVTRVRTQQVQTSDTASQLRIDGRQDSVENSLIFRTPDGAGNDTDRMRFGSGSAMTLHITSRTSIDGLLRTSGAITALGAITASGGQLEATSNGVRVPAGSTTIPAFRFNSEDSLGWYRSGVSTMALSFGTLNMALNSVRLSMRTLATSAVTLSAANTNVAINEIVITVGGASGASLCINSGGTTYIISSDLSAKNT